MASSLTPEYISGYWAALNRVLALLQTYESNQLNRKEVYRDIHDMRPRI